MPDIRDEVRAIIAGKELSSFTGVSISMAIDQIADAFSLTAPFDPDRADLRAAFSPFAFQPIEIYIGTERVLTGRIERVESSLSTDGISVNIQGRSLTASIVDCGIDGPLEFNRLALSTIASQVCKPFGVRVRADNDTNPIEVARAEYGQTGADFLNSLAAPRLLLLNSSYSGELVISWARGLKSRPVVADLEEGKGFVKSVSASFDGQRRFSVYKAATQFAGAADVIGTSRDSSIKINRPMLSAVGDTDQDPNVTAARMRSEAEASAFSCEVQLAGWRRPDGARWAERQAVTLLAPSSMLFTRARYIIAECNLTLDESGQSTSLRLALPETYLGESPGVVPWA